MNNAVSYLKQDLTERVVTVTFRKIDGDIRIMDCTRNLDLVPPSKWPTGKIVEDENADTIRVYDVKAQGWRSFVISNVIEVRSERLAMKWPTL